jgi:16S rRNA A1518/A1519 N6-dimethyltransferase RsmA/KsgA/DIM1 with predicted DNA glycosylase/AP lyase activity
MGYRLADRVLDVTRDIDTVVDVSSGRGFVTRHLETVKKVVALEMSKTYLEQCQMPQKEYVSIAASITQCLKKAAYL